MMDEQRFLVDCWHCESTTIQHEYLPAEVYKNDDIVILRTQCKCGMFNTRILSLKEYEDAKNLIAKLKKI